MVEKLLQSSINSKFWYFSIYVKSLDLEVTVTIIVTVAVTVAVTVTVSVTHTKWI